MAAPPKNGDVSFEQAEATLLSVGAAFVVESNVASWSETVAKQLVA